VVIEREAAETVTMAQVHEACVRITARPSYEILTPGNVTLRAPLVIPDNGVTVGSGAVLGVGGW
jgi:hypothetical protein